MRMIEGVEILSHWDNRKYGKRALNPALRLNGAGHPRNWGCPGVISHLSWQIVPGKKAVLGDLGSARPITAHGSSLQRMSAWGQLRKFSSLSREGPLTGGIADLYIAGYSEIQLPLSAKSGRSTVESSEPR